MTVNGLGDYGVCADNPVIDTLRIGDIYMNGNEEGFFNGSIDDVRYYNRALSAADITALYTATGGTSAGCTNPDRPEGTMLYNTGFNVVQYCDGQNWIGIGK